MILAVDPGSIKSGMAIVCEDGSLVWKKVIRTEDFEKEIQELLDKYTVSVVVMGNGTHHKKMQRRAEDFFKSKGKNINIELVDEKYTTEMGEAWYKRDHPATGWQRFIPEGFRSIPVPVDDYVAWIIGSIYLGLICAEDVGHKKV